MKKRTIDDLCGSQGAFKKFLKMKEEHNKKAEARRKERIAAARAERQLSWAA
jgi:hypothetical protein